MTHWITSEHKPRPQRATQTRLTPDFDHNHYSRQQPITRTSSRSSSSDGNPSASRGSILPLFSVQTRLDMGQGQQPTEKSSSSKKTTATPDSLTALQNRLAKDQPKLGNYLERMGVKPVQSVPTGTSANDKAPVTRQTRTASKPIPAATTAATITFTSMKATASTDTKGSLAKSKRQQMPVSIADKIPRGSRSKPIVPSKNQVHSTRLSTGSESPQPSIAHFTRDDTPTSDNATFAPSSVSSMSRHADHGSVIVLSSSPSDSVVDPTEEEYEMAQGETPATGQEAEHNIPREPSILTIDSSKTYSLASDIPSIEVDAIERWVGGVHDALSSISVPQATAASRSSKPISGSMTTRLLQTSEDTRPQHTIRIDPTPPHMIQSSLENEGKSDAISPSLETESPLPKKNSDDHRVLVSDSLSAASFAAPGPSSFGDSQINPIKLGRSFARNDDDISTVVGGGQPTQDSFGLHSLPSFLHEQDDVDRTEDNATQQQRPQQIPTAQEQSALPSGLTSSCLQELGLLKRRLTDTTSPRKRRTSAGWANSQWDNTGECNDDDVMLGQRAHFPSSFGAAPSTMSPLSYNQMLGSIDEDSFKYQAPEDPFRSRQRQQRLGRITNGGGEEADNDENDDDDQAEGQGARVGTNDEDEDTQEYPSVEDYHRRSLAESRILVNDSQPSLISMPSMTGLSTLPSFPSMPSSIVFHENNSE